MAVRSAIEEAVSTMGVAILPVRVAHISRQTRANRFIDAGSAAEAANEREKPLEVDGLGEEARAVAALRQAVVDRRRGQDRDRDRREPLVGAERLAEAPAVHDRHLQVE